MKPQLLMHICCAPCAILPILNLQEEYEITGLFFNPNIHPYKEYLDRKKSVIELGAEFGIPVLLEDYPYQEFLAKTVNKEEKKDRCSFCYQSRLNRLKVVSERIHIETVTTSLMYSIYQNYDLVLSLANQTFKNDQFLVIDYREKFWQGVSEAKLRNYYMQKYCGCIFSNYERYYDSQKK